MGKTNNNLKKEWKVSIYFIMFIFLMSLSLGFTVVPSKLQSSGCSNGYYIAAHGLTSGEHCRIEYQGNEKGSGNANSCGVWKFDMTGQYAPGSGSYTWYKIYCDSGGNVAQGFYYGTVGGQTVCSQTCIPEETGCTNTLCSAGCSNGVCNSASPVNGNSYCNPNLGIAACYDSYSCKGVIGHCDGNSDPCYLQTSCPIYDPLRDCTGGSHQPPCCDNTYAQNHISECYNACIGANPNQYSMCNDDSICKVGSGRPPPYLGCIQADYCTTFGDHTGDTCRCPADSPQNAGKVNADCGYPTEICNNGIDDDSIDGIDCEDYKCAGQTGQGGNICCPSGNSNECAVNGRSIDCVTTCNTGTFECSYKPATPQSECNSAFLCSDSNKAPNSYGVGDKLLPSNAFCDGSGYCSAVYITGVACTNPSNYVGPPPSASQCVDGQETCQDMRTGGALCSFDSGCAAEYYCTDTDGDGDLGTGTNYGGTCTKCDGAIGSICGAIAHDGIQYGVCTGSSSGNFYGCADQEMADNTYTVGGTSFNDPLFKTVCQTKGYGGGGIVRTATSNIPINYDVYTKCGLKSVCSGGATYPSGGECKETTALFTEVKLKDGTDNDEDKVSINHNITITHIIKNDGSSPMWAYETWCFSISDGVYEWKCNDPSASTIPSTYWPGSLYLGATKILQPDLLDTVTKEVNLDCKRNLIGKDIHPGAGQINTNSFNALYNGFIAGEYSPSDFTSNTITVVECKTDSDCDACDKKGQYCDSSNTCQPRPNGMNCGLNPEQCQCIAGNSPKPSPNLITNPGFEI